MPGPYDERAIQVVRGAQQGNTRLAYGPPDPYHRTEPFDNLTTRANPKGQGILVTAWTDQQRGATADWSRKRFVWLVLDGKAYPINQRAANGLGPLYDGLPASVQKRAGLVHTYERGRTMMDQLGIEDVTFVRRGSENPFPTCR